MKPILTVEDLHVHFVSNSETTYAVNGLSIKLYSQEILGIVGESGSGKSVAVKSILGLLPETAQISGKIALGEERLDQLNSDRLRQIRGKEIAMIFQDPMTSLNPLFTISDQMTRVIERHLHLDKQGANELAELWLRRVGITDAKRRLNQYPHEFSGGMRQRVMIAMAMSLSPRVLIADEPTTALDVTIQKQILGLIRQMESEVQNSVILITHDLGVVANTCHRMVVMYGGMIMEQGNVSDVFSHPAHPYTQGLMDSLPSENNGRHLVPIPGQPAIATTEPKLCPFLDRCPKSISTCFQNMPVLTEIKQDHLVRCWLVEQGGNDETI